VWRGPRINSNSVVGRLSCSKVWRQAPPHPTWASVESGLPEMAPFVLVAYRTLCIVQIQLLKIVAPCAWRPPVARPY